MSARATALQVALAKYIAKAIRSLREPLTEAVATGCARAVRERVLRDDIAQEIGRRVAAEVERVLIDRERAALTLALGSLGAVVPSNADADRHQNT